MKAFIFNWFDHYDKVDYEANRQCVTVVVARTEKAAKAKIKEWLIQQGGEEMRAGLVGKQEFCSPKLVLDLKDGGVLSHFSVAGRGYWSIACNEDGMIKNESVKESVGLHN